MKNSIISKEAIIKASRSIALNRGIRVISIRGVASECGVSIGSIYNYFPSKADLMAATIEDIWKSIFHVAGRCSELKRFDQCIRWIYESIVKGIEEYPDFFVNHWVGFDSSEKKTGRKVMEKYFSHIKNGMMSVLESDGTVELTVFDDDFTKDSFIDYVFTNILTTAISKKENCEYLINLIAKII